MSPTSSSTDGEGHLLARALAFTEKKNNKKHSFKRDKTKTSLRVIGQAARASLGWRWGRKRQKHMELRDKRTHQSLISCALESRPTFFLQVLSPCWDPRAFHPQGSTVTKRARTCVLFHGTCVLLMCSRDCNVPDGWPRWFVKNDGTSAGDSINDALAMVTSSLCAEKHTLTRTRAHTHTNKI